MNIFINKLKKHSIHTLILTLLCSVYILLSCSDDSSSSRSSSRRSNDSSVTPSSPSPSSPSPREDGGGGSLSSSQKLAQKGIDTSCRDQDKINVALGILQKSPSSTTEVQTLINNPDFDIQKLKNKEQHIKSAYSLINTEKANGNEVGDLLDAGFDISILSTKEDVSISNEIIGNSHATSDQVKDLIDHGLDLNHLKGKENQTELCHTFLNQPAKTKDELEKLLSNDVEIKKANLLIGEGITDFSRFNDDKDIYLTTASILENSKLHVNKLKQLIDTGCFDTFKGADYDEDLSDEYHSFLVTNAKTPGDLKDLTDDGIDIKKVNKIYEKGVDDISKIKADKDSIEALHDILEAKQVNAAEAKSIIADEIDLKKVKKVIGLGFTDVAKIDKDNVPVIEVMLDNGHASKTQIEEIIDAGLDLKELDGIENLTLDYHAFIVDNAKTPADLKELTDIGVEIKKVNKIYEKGVDDISKIKADKDSIEALYDMLEAKQVTDVQAKSIIDNDIDLKKVKKVIGLGFTDITKIDKDNVPVIEVMLDNGHANKTQIEDLIDNGFDIKELNGNENLTIDYHTFIVDNAKTPADLKELTDIGVEIKKVNTIFDEGVDDISKIKADKDSIEALYDMLEAKQITDVQAKSIIDNDIDLKKVKKVIGLGFTDITKIDKDNVEVIEDILDNGHANKTQIEDLIDNGFDIKELNGNENLAIDYHTFIVGNTKTPADLKELTDIGVEIKKVNTIFDEGVDDISKIKADKDSIEALYDMLEAKQVTHIQAKSIIDNDIDLKKVKKVIGLGFTDLTMIDKDNVEVIETILDDKHANKTQIEELIDSGYDIIDLVGIEAITTHCHEFICNNAKTTAQLNILIDNDVDLESINTKPAVIDDIVNLLDGGNLTGEDANTFIEIDFDINLLDDDEDEFKAAAAILRDNGTTPLELKELIDQDFKAADFLRKEEYAKPAHTLIHTYKVHTKKIKEWLRDPSNPDIEEIANSGDSVDKKLFEELDDIFNDPKPTRTLTLLTGDTLELIGGKTITKAGVVFGKLNGREIVAKKMGRREYGNQFRIADLGYAPRRLFSQNDEKGNTIFVLMEKGDKIRNTLEEKQKESKDKAIAWVKAFDKIKKKGISFRDIKPKNMLQKGDGTPLFIDTDWSRTDFFSRFDIKALNSTKADSQTASLCRSLLYFRLSSRISNSIEYLNQLANASSEVLKIMKDENLTVGDKKVVKRRSKREYTSNEFKDNLRCLKGLESDSIHDRYRVSNTLHLAYKMVTCFICCQKEAIEEINKVRADFADLQKEGKTGSLTEQSLRDIARSAEEYNNKLMTGDDLDPDKDDNYWADNDNERATRFFDANNSHLEKFLELDPTYTVSEFDKILIKAAGGHYGYKIDQLINDLEANS